MPVSTPNQLDNLVVAQLQHRRDVRNGEIRAQRFLPGRELLLHQPGENPPAREY
jgi:hypothetical protein